MKEEPPYNPLDYANLTKNVVTELMTRGPFGLPLADAFLGSGVYALFYNGDFGPYRPFCSPDSAFPIYVGKAVPRGARKGSKASSGNDPALVNRLREHAQSIKAAGNLKLNHFTCRYLTVIPLWITMAERFLVEHYPPVWNVCIEGFGNHDPGSGRHQGIVSWWDTLHPGRAWAEKLVKTRGPNDAIERLHAFLAHKPISHDEPEDDGSGEIVVQA